MHGELDQQMKRAEVDEYPAQSGHAELDESAVAGAAQPPDVVHELQHAVEAELGDAAVAARK